MAERNNVLDNLQDASTKMLIMASFHNLTSTTVKECSKSSIAWSAISTTVLNTSPALLSQLQFFFQATSVSVRLTKWNICVPLSHKILKILTRYLRRWKLSAVPLKRVEQRIYEKLPGFSLTKSRESLSAGSDHFNFSC